MPTHEDGTCLFWEFATDSYDLGFGVYFEWTIAPSNQVSVHVSESSDEEDLEEEGGDGECWRKKISENQQYYCCHSLSIMYSTYINQFSFMFYWLCNKYS